ncbi:hypothetical protein [Kitasatospora sp. NPDC057223]|uniref:hypothetical protein n=1 Tax=Kitasatospora sp. NPDC057223 TaxID=3346055 RepID=UPI003624BED0
MPKALSGGFLKILHSLHSLANEDGVLRFRRSGDGIPLGQIALGAMCDVKDARRYLRAAIAAGLVRVVGEIQRGFAVVYALVVPGWEPDWAAAVESLVESRRERPEGRERPDWMGGRTPGVGRGADPRGGEGDGPPHTQDVSHGVSQVELPVVDHVQAPRARARVTREAAGAGERARQWREFTGALPVDLRPAAVGLPVRHPSRLAAVAAMAEHRFEPAELGGRAGGGPYRADVDPQAVLVARLDRVLTEPPARTGRTATRAAAQAAARAAVRESRWAAAPARPAAPGLPAQRERPGSRGGAATGAAGRAETGADCGLAVDGWEFPGGSVNRR